MLYEISNATDYVGLMQYVETGVPVPYAEISMIIVFFVSFFIFLRYGAVKSFAASTFIAALLGVFFLSLGILSNIYVNGLIVMVSVSIILLYFSEG